MDDNKGQNTCPIACGNSICYKYTQSCEDMEKGEFTVLLEKQKCKGINHMKQKDNQFVSWICETTAFASDKNDMSYLAQDRCEESCQNPACTCADRPFAFWTSGTDVEGYGVEHVKVEPAKKKKMFRTL